MMKVYYCEPERRSRRFILEKDIIKEKAGCWKICLIPFRMIVYMPAFRRRMWTVRWKKEDYIMSGFPLLFLLSAGEWWRRSWNTMSLSWQSPVPENEEGGLCGYWEKVTSNPKPVSPVKTIEETGEDGTSFTSIPAFVVDPSESELHWPIHKAISTCRSCFQ